MIDEEKVAIIIIFENKKYVDRLKHSNKRRSKKCYVLIKKYTSKIKKHIIPMDFEESLEKSDVSENKKVYYGRFL